MSFNSLPAGVENWLIGNNYGQVVKRRPVGGGCISHGEQLLTSSGQTFFLKTNQQAPEDMFEREAEGLTVLQVEDGPRVPRPFLFDREYILLEDLNPTGHSPDYWLTFGRNFAALHNHTHAQFGFAHHNYIGSTPQMNTWTGDGFEFFGQQRLMFQARLALDQGYLNTGQVRQIEQIIHRLPELAPVQPASLVHGDLWSGNALTDENGQPALIDPAAHYGWAEADLAMTTLFGAFPEAFYQSYLEIRSLPAGYRQRFRLYNLYHLINHLNLFGQGYLGDVLSVVRQFS